MLISSGIIDHVKWTLDQIPRYNPTRIQFPFTLKSYKGSILIQNLSHQDPNEISYKFKSNLGNSASNWLYHVFIFATVTASISYQVIFEDQSLEEYAIHLLQVGSYIQITLNVYLHHTEGYINFLNQLLQFEIRKEAFADLELERKYWRTNQCCKLIAFSIQTFTFLFTSFQFVFPASLAILPYSFWRFLPAVILNQFAKLNFGGTSGIALAEITKRVYSFVHSYVIMVFTINRFLIMIIVSIIMAQGSLVLMLLAFRRHSIKRNRFIRNIEKLNATVKMYREIQLICKIYNEMHQMKVIPTIMVTTSTATTVSLFTLMSKSVEKKVQTLIVFCNLLLVVICAVVFAFQFAVKFYMEGKRLLGRYSGTRHDEISNHLTRRRERRVMKKYARSFPILKIFFFESNFIEGNTSLIVLNFAITWAINLVLCEK